MDFVQVLQNAEQSSEAFQMLKQYAEDNIKEYTNQLFSIFINNSNNEKLNFLALSLMMHISIDFEIFAQNHDIIINFLRHPNQALKNLAIPTLTALIRVLLYENNAAVNEIISKFLQGLNDSDINFACCCVTVLAQAFNGSPQYVELVFNPLWEALAQPRPEIQKQILESFAAMETADLSKTTNFVQRIHGITEFFGNEILIGSAMMFLSNCFREMPSLLTNEIAMNIIEIDMNFIGNSNETIIAQYIDLWYSIALAEKTANEGEMIPTICAIFAEQIITFLLNHLSCRRESEEGEINTYDIASIAKKSLILVSSNAVQESFPIIYQFINQTVSLNADAAMNALHALLKLGVKERIEELFENIMELILLSFEHADKNARLAGLKCLSTLSTKYSFVTFEILSNYTEKLVPLWVDPSEEVAQEAFSCCSCIYKKAPWYCIVSQAQDLINLFPEIPTNRLYLYFPFLYSFFSQCDDMNDLNVIISTFVEICASALQQNEWPQNAYDGIFGSLYQLIAIKEDHSFDEQIINAIYECCIVGFTNHNADDAVLIPSIIAHYAPEIFANENRHISFIEFLFNTFANTISIHVISALSNVLLTYNDLIGNYIQNLQEIVSIILQHVTNFDIEQCLEYLTQSLFFMNVLVDSKAQISEEMIRNVMNALNSAVMQYYLCNIEEETVFMTNVQNLTKFVVYAYQTYNLCEQEFLEVAFNITRMYSNEDSISNELVNEMKEMAQYVMQSRDPNTLEQAHLIFLQNCLEFNEEE